MVLAYVKKYLWAARVKIYWNLLEFTYWNLLDLVELADRAYE